MKINRTRAKVSSQITVDDDIDIGGYELLTTDLAFGQYDAYVLQIQNRAKSALRSLRVYESLPSYMLRFVDSPAYIRPNGVNDSYIDIQGYDNAGGYTRLATVRSGVFPRIELVLPKLIGDLDCNSQKLTNPDTISTSKFFPAVIGDNTSLAIYNNRPCIELRDANTDTCFTPIKIPDDFYSFTSAKVLACCSANAGNCACQSIAFWAAVNQSTTNETETESAGTCQFVGPNIFYELDWPTGFTFSTLAADDNLIIKNIRAGADGTDTMTGSAYISGIVLYYDAYQLKT